MQDISNYTPSKREAGSQLMLFMMLVSIGFMLMVSMTSLLAPLFPHALNDKNEIVDASFLRAAQVVQFAFLMFVPVLLYLTYFAPAIDKQFFNPPKSAKAYIYAALAFFVALPFIDFLAKTNQAMVFPQWLKGVESWMRQSEVQTNSMVSLMLSTTHWPTIAINACIIVLFPAVCEEFLFRGIIQQKLVQWWQSPLWAILATAFLFSAIHMQFLTFLPRFIQGIALGYLFYATSSVWVSVAAHFANNLIALAIFYYYRLYHPTVDPMQADTSLGSLWVVALSLLLTVYYIVQATKYKQENTIKQ